MAYIFNELYVLMCVLSSLQVLKILQKLKDLDITLDILAETGIGKTVNSFRRHEQAGELAKSLIKGWKKLVPKDSTSHGEDGCLSETVLVKQKFKDRDSPDKESWAVEGGCFTSYSKNQDSSDEALFETGKRRADSEKERCEKHDRSSGISRSPKPEESKKKMRQEKHNKKTKTKDKESKRDQEEPSMSFESCLNYDVNVFKRKEQSGVKKPPKKIKMVVKHSDMKPVKSPVTPPKQFRPQKGTVCRTNTPVFSCWLLCSLHFLFGYEVEKESDFCDVSEESAVFTGQRLNRKMQVYSGAKTTFLPAMLSLYQQCIRTLQNNINLLYETGGVPFELLEPVLERCTPEQLQRIEECNPIYIGVTDHLWGKHCEKDFKDAKLQEYESWKEMYIRLSEERERKLQRLTKTIVLAHSKKPKGRQVKMAFIHTVAKPPRDVRIQQEIHGTAVQQPHQLRCR
uniref:Elongin A, like n=1 Tax=Acanthochromis polyacanthus TaxID=80966 RepID=A0A3Q1FLX1_9TELE